MRRREPSGLRVFVIFAFLILLLLLLVREGSAQTRDREELFTPPPDTLRLYELATDTVLDFPGDPYHSHEWVVRQVEDADGVNVYPPEEERICSGCLRSVIFRQRWVGTEYASERVKADSARARFQRLKARKDRAKGQ